MEIVFAENSGLNDAAFGKWELPIRMMVERHGEDFEKNSVLKNLFAFGTSNNFGDSFTAMTAMEGFKPVDELEATPADGFQQSYAKSMEYLEWVDKFSVSKKMMEDNKILDIKRQPAAFMTGFGRTRERFGAALYGAAIQQAATAGFHGKAFDVRTADGSTLFAKEHAPKVKGKKQCNAFSDAFSADALASMETTMHLFKGDNDELLDVAPDTILIPEVTSLKKAVFAAIGADKEPTTANNAFNYVYGRWTVIVWPYLNQYIKAGTAPWILMDSTYNKTYNAAPWVDRVGLEFETDYDKNTRAYTWYGRSRFNATFNDWRYAAVGGVAGGNELSA